MQWAKDVWFARMFSPSGNSIDPADRHYLNEYNKVRLIGVIDHLRVAGVKTNDVHY